MRRARRVAYGGQVHEAVVAQDGVNLRLADGRAVTEADVVWLPPTRPGTIIALGLKLPLITPPELAFKAPEEPLECS